MNDQNVPFVLDCCAADGEWLVWDKLGGCKYRAGRDKPRVVDLIARLNKAHRPNIEADAKGILVCWNDHEKGARCEYERFHRVPPNTQIQRAR